MRLLLSLALLSAAWCMAVAQKPRVLITPVEVLDGKTLPQQAKKETQAAIGETVAVYIAQELHKQGIEMVKAVQAEKELKFVKDGLKGNSREVLESLEALGDAAGVDYVVVVQVTRWSQKDMSNAEILSSPNGPGSETKAEVRLWVFGKKDRAMYFEGAKFEATAHGQRIGTQKKGELFGAPADVAAMINAANKRRMTYIGKASWEAVKDPLRRSGVISQE